MQKVLSKHPRDRTAQEQDDLRQWTLDRIVSSGSEMPKVMDVPREQQRLLLGQMRGMRLAPHERLHSIEMADHRMYIVLRGELMVFGNCSHLGTVAVGSCVGQLNEEEYYHTDDHCAGEDGCLLGVLDYAHSLAAQRSIMQVANRVLQVEPAQRSLQHVRVLHALLEDVAFFQQLSIEAEQLGCCRLLRLEQLKEGSVVCEEGTIGEKFFVVLRGSVEVRVPGEEGGTEHLGVGGSFGKLSLLGQTDQDRQLHSTIIAGQDCACATLHRDEFQGVQQQVVQQLCATLAKPFLGRSREDTKTVTDLFNLVIAQSTDDREANKMLRQFAGHTTLLSMSAGQTFQLPGGSFVYVLEGRAVLDESQAVPGVTLSSHGGVDAQRFFGVESLLENKPGRTGGGPGSARECAQLMPVRAKGGGCKLLVMCSTDLRHVCRRSALQPWIDSAWEVCGGSSCGKVDQLKWTDWWKSVLKTLSPDAFFSADSALEWSVSDWHDMVKRAQWKNPNLRSDEDMLDHEAFSEALTLQVEDFWSISEPCPMLHAALLAELLAATTRNHGSSSNNRTAPRTLELGTVKCHSKFFMGLRNDARELMLQSLKASGRRSALERIEAELNESSFTLLEAFELEKSAPIFDQNNQRSLLKAETDLGTQAVDMSHFSHLASAVSAIPSQWSERLNAWAHGKVLPTVEAVNDEESGNNVETDFGTSDTAGSVEWARKSTENSDGDQEEREPVNPAHPPPSKMTPVGICGGPPPKNERDIRMASPPREKPREGPAPPPPGVRLQGSASAVPQNRAPAPPRTPPPVKRRSHKEIAKELYAHRHTATIQRVASEDSFGEKEPDRRLPVVSQGLARSGNTQSWAPKSHKLPQEIHIGNAKGRMRRFQAPPDPESIDTDTGLPKNRHRTIKPMDSPRNAEQRAAARVERQKLRAEKAAATRTVVPGKLAPEPPRTVLQPNIIGSVRSETKLMTAEAEKVVRMHGIDTEPDRVYAVLPSGVPKEWIALHYKSEKKIKAQKKEAAAKCAAAIARGVKVESARAPIKAAAKKKMPFVAAIGFTEMKTALQGGADTITTSHPITEERWLVREEGAYGSGRPPEIVPTATPYGHSGPRKPLERLAPPTSLSLWCAEVNH